MYKQSITYKDLDGIERKEDLYFHFSRLEVMEMQIKYNGGLVEYIKRLTETEPGPEAYTLFKDVLLGAYGQRTADARSFKKSPEIRQWLEGSPALEELIFGFLDGSIPPEPLINGMFPPKEVLEQAIKDAEKQKAETAAAAPTGGDPTTVQGDVVESRVEYTRQQLLDMPQHEFDRIHGTDLHAMDKDTILIAMERNKS